MLCADLLPELVADCKGACVTRGELVVCAGWGNSRRAWRRAYLGYRTAPPATSQSPAWQASSVSRCAVRGVQQCVDDACEARGRAVPCRAVLCCAAQQGDGVGHTHTRGPSLYACAFEAVWPGPACESACFTSAGGNSADVHERTRLCASAGGAVYGRPGSTAQYNVLQLRDFEAKCSRLAGLAGGPEGWSLCLGCRASPGSKERSQAASRDYEARPGRTRLD